MLTHRLLRVFSIVMFSVLELKQLFTVILTSISLLYGLMSQPVQVTVCFEGFSTNAEGSSHLEIGKTGKSPYFGPSVPLRAHGQLGEI